MNTPRESQAPRSTRRDRRTQPAKPYRWLKVIVILLLLTVISAYFLDKHFPVDLAPKQGVITVVDRQGEPLRYFFTTSLTTQTHKKPQHTWRFHHTLAEVSPRYLQALLTYEDRHFYTHYGVHFPSVVRAAWQWLRNGRIVSGASTITMQVARLRFKSLRQRGLLSKSLQMLRALQLEWHFSKTDILTYYINHAPFGGIYEGVGAATYAYFGHRPDNLTWAQAALLAGLPQAPSRYRPDKYPQQATQQRNKVLLRLAHFNVLTSTEVNDAQQESIVVETFKPPQLAALTTQRVVDQHTQQQASVTTLPTFIDASLQTELEATTRAWAQQLPSGASMAIIMMETRTGKVRAITGSAEFGHAQRFGYLDMTRRWRSPGSTLKPFIYALAIDNGLIHSESLLQDAPIGFGDYYPENFDHRFRGPVSASQALRASLNVPAVQVLDMLGPQRFYTTLANAGVHLKLANADINSTRKSVKPNLSLALGSASSHLSQLVSLYSSLGNDGLRVTPRVSTHEALHTQRLMSAGAAWITRTLLKQQDAKYHRTVPLHLKTGTSSGHKDVWALHSDSQWTIGVWVGSPDNRTLSGVYGANTAVPLLASIHQLAAVYTPHIMRDSRSNIADSHAKPNTPPSSVKRQRVCWPSGQIRQHCKHPKLAWILQQQIPPTVNSSPSMMPLTQTTHSTSQPLSYPVRLATDSGLQVNIHCELPNDSYVIDRWPARLQAYLPYEQQDRQLIPSIDPRCDGATSSAQTVQLAQPLLTKSTITKQLRLIGIKQGDVFALHPASQHHPQPQLQLINASAPCVWLLDQQTIDVSACSWQLPQLSPGKHEIFVSDATGFSDSVQFVIDPIKETF